MEFKGFTQIEVTDSLHDSIQPEQRGKAISLRKLYGDALATTYRGKALKVHDANFAFLSTTLSKLHNKLYEPLYWVTYTKDVPIDVGGGFVDYVTYYTVDWSGIMNEVRNVVGNNANYIPRVNAGVTQKRVNVFTWEVAYDLRFIELEKMKKLTLQKSIQDIYQNAIVAGWDLFAQKVAYTGIQSGTGLFNSANVLVTTIDNSGIEADAKGFEGLSDEVVVSFFNGIFSKYLSGSGNNITLLPDTILVPSFVGADLTSRFSALYTASLRSYIIEHNLAVDESDKAVKLTIASRPELDTLGTAQKGRIVAYKKDKTFLRLDVPYPIQHYITLPNIERMSYTTLFVGQISEIQMPYNTSSSELGVITYWDFTN